MRIDRHGILYHRLLSFGIAYCLVLVSNAGRATNSNMQSPSSEAMEIAA